MRHRARRQALLLGVLFLCGCALRASDPIEQYDFGLMPAAANKPLHLPADLRVSDAVAPAWLDTPAIHYRLAYRDGAQARAYGRSRWVAAPATLFTGRLRQRLGAANQGGAIVATGAGAADYLLHTELEEYSQVFDAPERGRVLVRVRASLIRTEDQQVLAQHTFDVARPAASPDAAGAVQALAGASDEVIEAMIEWLAPRLQSASRGALPRPARTAGHAMNRRDDGAL